MNNDQATGNAIHAPVFYTALLIIIFFLVVTLANLQQAESAFATVQQFFTQSFGWFLVITVNLLLRSAATWRLVATA